MRNWNSKRLTRGSQQGIKSFYYGLGWGDADFDKPLIGIGTPLHEINLCNLHALDLGGWIREGLAADDLLGYRIGVPSVSDNITQGQRGGCASLPSRNAIASATEMVATAHCFDGLIGLHLCDKNGPGFAMALARSNLPGFLLSGGTIYPGCLGERQLTIQDVYDTQAAVRSGRATAEDLDAVIRHACPGAGGCGIAASFNTWGLAMEALGLMPPYSSSNPAVGAAKVAECRQAGQWMARILDREIRPRDIITVASLRNATAMIAAAGGSTNGILHLLALAREAHVDFSLRDMQAVLRATPVYCDFAPRGRGTMIDLYEMGGTPLLIRHLIEAGVLDGSLPTLFADSLAEQVADAGSVPVEQDLIAAVGAPLKPWADIQVCFGNLAPDGIVFKVSNRQDPVFEGRAICFSDVDALEQAVQQRVIRPGHVVVLRGMGPVAMGMPEVLVATAALANPELEGRIALVSDARVSGVSHGAIGVHCAPEAVVGGPIARVCDGDPIRFDLMRGEIAWQETAAASPEPIEIDNAEVYLREFCASTTQADQGCVSRGCVSRGFVGGYVGAAQGR